MRRVLTLFLALAAPAALAGCSDDDGPMGDGGLFDSGDMGPDGMADMGPDGMADMGPDGMADMAMPDVGPDAPDMEVDAGPNPTSEEIAAILMAEPGPLDPALPVTDGYVTYVRELIGSDPAGFFVQAEQAGPALYVAVDPATLDPVPAVGDSVSFDVTEIENANEQIRAINIVDFSRSAEGFDVNALVQDLSAADDVVSMLDEYASELVVATGTIVSEGSFAGTGHTGYRFTTEGLMDDELVFRAPTSVIETMDLGIGCQLTAGPAPLWRFETTAQVSAFVTTEIADVMCPAPTLRGAEAPNDVTVRLQFSRALADIEVGDIAFTSAGDPLTATAVEIDGEFVNVTTNPQTDGLIYTVTVTGVTDSRGTVIDPDMNTAMFAGSGPAPTPGEGDMIIVEIFYDDGVAGSDNGIEWVEVFNPSADTTYQLLGCEIDDIADGGGMPLPIDRSIRVAPGETVVFGGEESETPADFTFGPGLNNSGDSVILRCGETTIDIVDYDVEGFPAAAGASLQLDPSITSAVNNDLPSTWCVASDASDYGTRGFKGTPGATNVACPGGNLLITEVVEGSSFNKAVELTNYGVAPVFLPSCELNVHSNGAITPTVTLMFPPRTLLPGESYVICNDAPANAAGPCNLDSNVIRHNGNDAYSLVCDEAVIDSYGTATLETGMGSFPTFTGTGGLSGANQTLLRQCGVVMGDTDLSDAIDLADEWESVTPADPSMSNDNFTNLGCHCASCE